MNNCDKRHNLTVTSSGEGTHRHVDQRQSFRQATSTIKTNQNRTNNNASRKRQFQNSSLRDSEISQLTPSNHGDESGKKQCTNRKDVQNLCT